MSFTGVLSRAVANRGLLREGSRICESLLASTSSVTIVRNYSSGTNFTSSDFFSGVRFDPLLAELQAAKELKKMQQQQLGSSIHFTPTGMSLLPQGLFPSGLAPLEWEAPAADGQEEVLQAIGIKTWRRLKMKKHKIRKRRRAERHKSK